MSDWTTVGACENLQPGQCKVLEIDDVMVAVYNIEGEYFAIEDTCTHDGGELASGELDGDEVICPRHGARFCVKTGEALTAPAYEDVDTYTVRVENDQIQVRNIPDE